MDLTNEFQPIRDWAAERGLYDKGDPKTQALKLMEEVGELAETIRQTCYGVKEPRTLVTLAKLRIVDESADVANLAMMIADRVYDLNQNKEEDE